MILNQNNTAAIDELNSLDVEIGNLIDVKFGEPVEEEPKEAIEEINLAVSKADVPPLNDSTARKEVAAVDLVGKYEPKLTENGISYDVLEKLLPGNEVIHIAEPNVAGGLGYRFIKRFFDIVSCGIVLILLAIPMAVIAIKIKSESEGPAIFSQRRVGKNGKIFNVYKFRSMYIDAELRGAQWAQGDDPRVTVFGKKLRKTRMDEIPQFWNVFKGDIPLRILKTRQVFSENKPGAFALPANEVRTVSAAFLQVNRVFRCFLRALQKTFTNLILLFDNSREFFAKAGCGLKYTTSNAGLASVLKSLNTASAIANVGVCCSFDCEVAA